MTIMPLLAQSDQRSAIRILRPCWRWILSISAILICSSQAAAQWIPAPPPVTTVRHYVPAIVQQRPIRIERYYLDAESVGKPIPANDDLKNLPPGTVIIREYYITDSTKVPKSSTDAKRGSEQQLNPPSKDEVETKRAERHGEKEADTAEKMEEQLPPWDTKLPTLRPLELQKPMDIPGPPTEKKAAKK